MTETNEVGTIDTALFPLGHVVATPGALRALAGLERPNVLEALLGRHLLGDWGDLGPEDWEANDLDLKAGGRLLSVYQLAPEVTVWVITEADRGVTTILLREEY